MPNKSEEEELESHVKFIENRLITFDFRVVEKLQRIEDLAEIVFAARRSYLAKRDDANSG